MARCPAHDDRKASLAVTEGRDGEAKLYCHAGCTFIEVRDALALQDRSPYVSDLPPEPVTAAVRDPLPAEADIEGWSRSLLCNDKALRRLRETRGWSAQTIAWMQVGISPKGLTIPHRDKAGELVNVAYYRPGSDPKMIVLRGRSRDLYPAPESFPPYMALFVVEGEPDAISACELGMPAVSIPGVNGWRREWAERFGGRRVVVVLDADTQGRQAASRIKADLLARHVQVKTHEYDSQRTDGTDLTDLLLTATRTGGNTLAVVRHAMSTVIA